VCRGLSWIGSNGEYLAKCTDASESTDWINGQRGIYISSRPAAQSYWRSVSKASLTGDFDESYDAADTTIGF